MCVLDRKVALCGSPHSGKSVLLVALKKALERRGAQYMLLRCAPDGEGTWSQEADQALVASIRRKGQFSGEWVAWCCKSIRNCQHHIVLVDLGGRQSSENRTIMAECNSAIVISSSEIEQWTNFARDCELEILAVLHSSLQGEEKIESSTPLVARIVGLERGVEIKSQVVEALADILASNLPVQEENAMPENATPEEKEAKFVIFNIPPPPGGIFEPSQMGLLMGLIPSPVEHAGEGIVLSGRAPVWVFGMLVHHCHPWSWVATYDPRLGGGVVVASHIRLLNVGDIVPCQPPA